MKNEMILAKIMVMMLGKMMKTALMLATIMA
jgi:hypothetical protein